MNCNTSNYTVYKAGRSSRMVRQRGADALSAREPLEQVLDKCAYGLIEGYWLVALDNNPEGAALYDVRLPKPQYEITEIC